MSEHITHLAVCDDAFRLLRAHPKCEPALVEVIDRHQDVAHLGAITRHADHWSVDLIGHGRDQQQLPEDQRDTRAMRKVAFTLGALTHRAADRMMKPIIRSYDEGKEFGVRETTVYMDLFVLREVFGGGSVAPFTTDVMEVPQDRDARRFETYLQAAFRRVLISMHTFKPDDANVHAWLDQFFDGVQEFKIEMDFYARCNAEWDPAKVQRYLVDQRFYDSKDPLIIATRALDRGDRVTGESVVEAIDATGKHSSRYARTLQRAMHYLLSAGELWRGEIDADTAKTRFDIGVPEMKEMD